MTNTLETLKELGAQKIHNETHITKEYVQSILHETFDGLSSVQFVGFISILEREYDADLSELKSQGLAHFSLSEDTKEVKKVFVVPKKKKSYANIYLTLGFLVIAAFIYYIFVYLASQVTAVETIDNSKIENAQSISQTLEIKNIALDINETNTSQSVAAKIIEKEIVKEDKIQEEAVEEVTTAVVIPEPVVEVKTLKLIPKNRIWAGYINIKTNQKYQKVFKKDFSFDTAKNWLLLFGAGTVKLEVDGIAKKYSSKQNMRFKYIDNKLTKITLTEFKRLNKGSKW